MGVPGCGEHLENWLLARSVSLLLTPPFLLVTSISFLPLLFSVTLWTSLSVPHCGEYIGNWLLARFFLASFDFPSSPGHLYLPPPSSLLHVTLLTSLGVPHCGESFHHWPRRFIIGAVWMEATVRIRLKARGRRLKYKTWEHQKTPDSRQHWLTRAHPKASIPTLKPSSTQEPRSFRARHTKLILQKHRNITLSIKIQAAKSHTKPIDTSKLTTGHFIALQREEIQLHPPEHQCKFP